MDRDQFLHALRFVVLFLLYFFFCVMMASSLLEALRSGKIRLRGGSTCKRKDSHVTFWLSVGVQCIALFGSFLLVIELLAKAWPFF